MSANDLTERCLGDGSMSPLFLQKASNKNYSVYNVCEFTHMEIKLDKPEYRNGVLYIVKWEKQKMSYKVKQLYIVWEDGDGHKYLIKVEDISAFERELKQLEAKRYSSINNYDEDDFFSDFENLLEYFNAERLEGEKVYIVLENDLIGGEED